MRLASFLVAAVLAVLPTAALAEDPPVRFDGDAVLDGPSATVAARVWIAFGYGKQILRDNRWLGYDRKNAPKVDADVVVRVESASCSVADVSLVDTLAAALGQETGPMSLPFFEELEAEAGFLWTVSVPTAGCSCTGSTLSDTFHCNANGKAWRTCDVGEGTCGDGEGLAVQALNRPANEKCTIDLGGDGRFECDRLAAPWEVNAVAGAARYVASGSGREWSHQGDEHTCVGNGNKSGNAVTIEVTASGVRVVSTTGAGLYEDKCGGEEEPASPAPTSSVAALKASPIPAKKLLGAKKLGKVKKEHLRLRKAPSSPQ